MTQGIYKIQAPSGNFYIGSSVKIERRFAQHKRHLKKGNHVNELLQRSANKYGVDCLNFEIVATVFDAKHLTDVEQIIMDDLRPTYNISKIAFSAINDSSVAQKRIKVLSKPVVRLTDGVIFSSGYEAARHHGEKYPDNLSTAIKKGWKFSGHFWAFEGSELTLKQAQKISCDKEKDRIKNATLAATKARSKQVKRLSDGKIFSSSVEAARCIGAYRTAVNDAIRLNKIRFGSRWEYV